MRELWAKTKGDDRESRRREVERRDLFAESERDREIERGRQTGGGWKRRERQRKLPLVEPPDGEERRISKMKKLCLFLNSVTHTFSANYGFDTFQTA